MRAFFQNIPARVFGQMNQKLCSPYSEEEVLQALNQMNPTKAPRVDGLPALFFQKCWGTMKNEVSRVCLHILNHGGEVGHLNHIGIILIPKKKGLKHVAEYRPISLCTVIYKIISKTIANRVKLV